MDQNIQLVQVRDILEERNNEPKLTMDSSDAAVSPKSEKLESYCSPALMNEIVLDRVFGFLALEDIKNGRRVCFRWNEVLKSALNKSSIVNLTLNGIQNWTELKKDFPSELPFENLRIHNGLLPGVEPNLWEVSQLEEVFDHLGNNLKHLELDIAFNGNPTRPLEMRPVTLCSLTTLILNCQAPTSSIKVSLEHLRNIKIIRLIKNVILDIGVEGFKISPKAIELIGIKFESNESRLDKIILNQFIEFRTAKMIKIWNSVQERAQQVFLDMTQSITVDTLDLLGVEVLEISKATWNVKGHVSLNNVPWTERNQMTFTSLNFLGGEIHIHKLPSTMERLLLIATPPILGTTLPIEPKNLKNLKFLSLDDRSPGDGLFLTQFKHCTKLEAVRLILSHKIQPCILKIQTVPPSVRRIEIVGKHIVGGHGFHGLETIILSHCAITQNLLVEIVQKFLPKNIVIDTRCWARMRHACFKKYMKLYSHFQIHNKIDFWMGPLAVVGSRKQYYFKDHLTGQRGCRKPKVISEQEFQKVRQLSILDDCFSC